MKTRAGTAPSTCPFLEVTFRKGRPVVAYLHLTEGADSQAVRTIVARPTILVDYSASGEPIGLELTAPALASTRAVNEVLRSLGAAPIDGAELSPLQTEQSRDESGSSLFRARMNSETGAAEALVRDFASTQAEFDDLELLSERHPGRFEPDPPSAEVIDLSSRRPCPAR